jgi:hypothetical protein
VTVVCATRGDAGEIADDGDGAGGDPTVLADLGERVDPTVGGLPFLRQDAGP